MTVSYSLIQIPIPNHPVLILHLSRRETGLNMRTVYTENDLF